jgi:hypothetical protein
MVNEANTAVAIRTRPTIKPTTIRMRPARLTASSASRVAASLRASAVAMA